MILSVDPGLATCGWAVVEECNGKLVDLGVITQAADAKGGKNADRLARLQVQSAELLEVAEHFGARVIVAESLSFNPKAFGNMIASVCLSWGALVGLAQALDVHIVAIPPKRWQNSVLGYTAKKIDYDVVFALLSSYVLTTAGEALHGKLARIAKGQRNHALDAVGVGVHAAMREPAVAVPLDRVRKIHQPATGAST